MSSIDQNAEKLLDILINDNVLIVHDPSHLSHEKCCFNLFFLTSLLYPNKQTIISEFQSPPPQIDEEQKFRIQYYTKEFKKYGIDFECGKPIHNPYCEFVDASIVKLIELSINDFSTIAMSQRKRLDEEYNQNHYENKLGIVNGKVAMIIPSHWESPKICIVVSDIIQCSA